MLAIFLLLYLVYELMCIIDLRYLMITTFEYSYKKEYSTIIIKERRDNDR